jgi:hypothetical protein
MREPGRLPASPDYNLRRRPPSTAALSPPHAPGEHRCLKGVGSAASWPPAQRQVVVGRTTAARARCKRHHVCFKAGAGLLQRADAGDARGHRRCYKGNQGWRRCYNKSPPLLHVSASVATSGRHFWYIRPPVLLCSSSAVATFGHRCCYIRLPVLLRSSSAAAT